MSDVQLKCPGCGDEVVSLSYMKTFVFHHGIREELGWTWLLGCCGATLLDEDLDWNARVEDDSLAYTPVSLADKNGNVVLAWLDSTPISED